MKSPGFFVQIVPRMLPVSSGIGDYSLLLARELREKWGLDSRFIVAHPEWAPDRAIQDFQMLRLKKRSASALTLALDEIGASDRTPVLLHYVPHGYAQRACPFWLLAGLNRWKRSSEQLITLFHEVHGSGPIWSSGFWTSPIQYWLATRLAKMSALCRTTTDVTLRQVQKMVGPKKAGAVAVSPVFSTTGEPAAVLPLDARKRQMVIFGSGCWKSLPYTRWVQDLIQICQRLKIERIVDVGETFTSEVTLPIPLVQMGFLDAARASEVFNESLAGYFTYPMPYLGKSTIFAAYTAHGMIPVTFGENLQPNLDGVRIGEHVLTNACFDPDSADSLERIAQAAHCWYYEHRLAVRAERVFRDVETMLAKE